jgi:hypothetical protein
VLPSNESSAAGHSFKWTDVPQISLGSWLNRANKTRATEMSGRTKSIKDSTTNINIEEWKSKGHNYKIKAVQKKI